jgi:outer membrane lipoprotein-sorting protein
MRAFQEIVVGTVILFSATSIAVAHLTPLPVPSPRKQAVKNDLPPLTPYSEPTANNVTVVPTTTSSIAMMATPARRGRFDVGQRMLADRVSGYLSSVRILSGNFVQVGPDGARTEGHFYIQKPGKVRFAYNPPSPIDVIADGSSVVVFDRKLATQDLYPLSQTPLRYLLVDKIDLLRDTNVISVSADNVFVTLVIEEKHLLTGTSRLMMMFGAKDFQLRQWTVTDPQGYETTVAVYNLDTKTKPNPELFEINYERNLP